MWLPWSMLKHDVQEAGTEQKGRTKVEAAKQHGKETHDLLISCCCLVSLGEDLRGLRFGEQWSKINKAK